MNYYRKINREHIQFDFLTNKEHIAFEDEIRQLGGKIYKVLSPKAGYIKYKKAYGISLKFMQRSIWQFG